jgi:transcriptional regulator EpsA
MESSYSKFANPLFSGSWLRPSAERLRGTLRGGSRAPKALPMTPEESGKLFRALSASSLIATHYDVLNWLNGDIHDFLPHDILVSSWGDFTSWNLRFDVVSALPGVRTACPIDDVIKECHVRWSRARREPLMLRMSDLPATGGACECPVHAALRGMRWILVHGTRDARNRNESLYLAFSSANLTKRSQARSMSLAHLLITQFEVAIRTVAALPVPQARAGESHQAGGLSTREKEIVEWLRQGKTNYDIGVVLDISPFTVKNHMQRIFRKLGASNRTEAVAKYNERAGAERAVACI